MNLFTAINNALQIALETDPKAVSHQQRSNNNKY